MGSHAKRNPNRTVSEKNGVYTSKKAVPKTGTRLTAGRIRQHFRSLARRRGASST